jgi:predicted phage tail protein
VVYHVRTYVSAKKMSANSGDVSLKLYRVPAPIVSLDEELTENAIQLKWQAPSQTAAGEPIDAVQEYHIYRGELEPASEDAAKKDVRQGAWKAPLIQVATTTLPGYQDVGFDYGKTYAYLVRSVIVVNRAAIESGNSALVVLTPRDTFPPAAPQGIVAAVLSGAVAGTSVVDLSWSINVETDLAGYRVYRSEQEGTRGELLTPEVLLTPAYRDTSVKSGEKYWYTVTAVDRSGNESTASAQAAVEVTQPSP